MKIVLSILSCLLFQTALSTNSIKVCSDSTNAEKERTETALINNPTNEIEERLKLLNEQSPIDLVYTQYVQS